MAEKSSNWQTIFMAITTILLLFVAYGVYTQEPNVVVDTDALAAKIQPVVTVPQPTTTTTTDQAKLDAILAQVQKEDKWKAEAIELVKKEIDARELRRFLNNNGYDIAERSDIDKWVYRDTDVESFDVDEKDATVTGKLRVYFYDESAEDDLKATVFFEAVIDDSIVDDLDFEL